MRTELQHGFILTVSTGLTALLSLVYTVYVGTVLGPSAYADFTAALSLCFLFNIALGPINGTVTRFTAQYASQQAFGKIVTLHRAFVRKLAWYGLGAAVVSIAVIPYISAALRFGSPRTLWIAVAVTYLTLLLSVARGVLRGVQRFGLYSVNIVSEAAVRPLLGVGLLWVVRGATSGLAAYVLALGLVLALSQVQLRAVWRGAEREPLDGAAVRRYTVPLFVMMLTQAGFENIDMLFVKGCFRESEAGVYGAAFILARSITVVVTPFATLLLPMLTTLYEQGRGVVAPFLRICGYFVLLAAGPMLLFGLLPETIMEALYGEAYRPAAPLLLPLAGARLVTYLATLIGLTYASAGRFSFLLVYVPGLAVQIAALALWHDALATVVWVLLTVQGAMGVGMIAWLCCRPIVSKPGPIPVD